jgi:hypothetical protein
VGTIFVSYARRDQEFAQYLLQALTERGRDVWVDWKDIHAGSEWDTAINDAIDGADVFVPVLTAEWSSSAQCKTELAHAAEREKRILPLLRRDLDPDSVPEAVRAIQWISFRNEDDAEAALTSLIAAIDTEPAWLRHHTLLLARAAEWEQNLRDPSYLLRGGLLERSEEWLARQGGKEPLPTRMQLEFILASRRASAGVERRKRHAVFISYRRDETRGYAGRLQDRLSALLGEKNVFMDLDSIRPGIDFVSALREGLDSTAALIALIGDQWLELREQGGQRRLDNPGDFVRLELEGALTRGIAVVPVLVDRARMPSSGELPPTLAELARLQALELSHEHWKRDVDRLIAALPAEARHRRSRLKWLRS